MRSIIQKSIYFCMASLLIWACKKDETKAVLKQGTLSGFSASSTTLVLDSTNASSTNGVTFTWDAASYGANVATNYVLQIDSAAGNFTKPVNVTMGNKLTKSYTVADFNQLAMSLGLAPETAGQLHARVKSDVVVANSSASTIPTVFSDVLTLTVTPYSVKPKPKFPVPDSLYIVGSATPGGDAHGWDNPVPIPSQRFTKIDDNTFGIIINLWGGKEYLFLPKNGDWSHKYNVPDNSDPSLKDGGSFFPDAGNPNIPGPAADGLYKIIVDFVAGTYTVTPVDPASIPDNLYLVGSATPGGDAHGWDNPVPVPSQQFTKTDAYTFEITIPLIGGKEYLFLPVNGDWSHKYAVKDKTIPSEKMGGTFVKDASDNFPGPDASGNYKIVASFLNNQYTVTQQ